MTGEHVPCSPNFELVTARSRATCIAFGNLIAFTANVTLGKKRCSTSYSEDSRAALWLYSLGIAHTRIIDNRQYHPVCANHFLPSAQHFLLECTVQETVQRGKEDAKKQDGDGKDESRQFVERYQAGRAYSRVN